VSLENRNPPPPQVDSGRSATKAREVGRVPQVILPRRPYPTFPSLTAWPAACGYNPEAAWRHVSAQNPRKRRRSFPELRSNQEDARASKAVTRFAPGRCAIGRDGFGGLLGRALW